MSGGRDVIVVGAGPVGFLVALGLARAGAEVTVLDCESGINSSPRAAIYFPTTLALLDKLGLLEDALAIGLKSTLFTRRYLETGESIAADLRDILPPGERYDYNLHFGQHILADLVMRHLERLPNARVLWDHKVVSLDQDAAGVTLGVETPEGVRSMTSDWVVGADGARSAVRHLLGLSFDGFTWPERFVATNVEYDFGELGFAPANMIMDPLDWGVCARLGRENLWRVTFGEDAGLDEATVGERIPARYEVLFPGIGAYRIDRFSPYRVHERCASAFRAGRVLLAGDAAHACNPCGGFGLTSGVIDADVLAEALGAVIGGRAGEDLLDFYAAERRRVFLEVTSPMAREMKRLLSEADPARRAADKAMITGRTETARGSPTMSRGILGQPLPV